VFGYCKCYTHKALEYRLSSLGPAGRWFNCSKFANTTTANRSRGESLESIIPFATLVLGSIPTAWLDGSLRSRK